MDNKILRYLEGQLTGQDKKAFEALIESSSELQLEVEMLGNLIDNQPNETPPYEVRQKIYKMVGIKDASFMDVAIKKADQFLDIILGKEYFLDIEPAFITRSSEKSLLFSKKMNDFDILCDIYSEENGQYLMNLAASKNDKEIDNIKFSITQDSKHNIEKYTQSNGNTGSFIINLGVYYINISTLKSEIGNIKINLS
tara:strand:+ start:770 stop:1360 length:591 start_codon:yes stop_codon:yes gene_type:complete